ncbi:MAG: DUF255 domain-containing protein [Bacteroidota bacterium]
MKKQHIIIFLILSLIFYFPSSLLAQGPENSTGRDGKIKWYSFEDAYALCKKKPRKMIVDVYTEWCGWCKRMDSETFTNPVIVKYMNSHFYCVKLDAERKDTIILDGTKLVNPNPASKRSTHQLANQLLHNSMSYPSYVFLNDRGNFITTVPGYHQPREFEAILSFIGEDAYVKSTAEEFQKTFDDYISRFRGEIK